MRVVAALLLVLVFAVPALADEPEPFRRTCSSSQYGDLGRGWKEHAVVAGSLALVGMGVADGRAAIVPSPQGMGRPYKVLVVVDPNAVATLTVAPRSRSYAALGYNEIRYRGGESVPLVDGAQSVRFEACRAVPTRASWNRGTQFGGTFIVNGRRCVHVEVRARGRLLRRTPRFGVARCAS